MFKLKNQVIMKLKSLIVCTGVVDIIAESIVGMRLNTQQELSSILRVKASAFTLEYYNSNGCATQSSINTFFSGNDIYTSISYWCDSTKKEGTVCTNGTELLRNGIMASSEYSFVVCSGL
jgi:hypothetical protein